MSVLVREPGSGEEVTLFLDYIPANIFKGFSRLDVHWIVNKFNVRPWGKGNIGRDSRHENIIGSKKTSNIIICDYLGARIREK